jgi:protein subunit release factor A
MTLYNLDAFMMGEIDEMIDALKVQALQEKMEKSE